MGSCTFGTRNFHTKEFKGAKYGDIGDHGIFQPRRAIKRENICWIMNNNVEHYATGKRWCSAIHRLVGRDYRMMMQIQTDNEEFGSSNLFTEHTRPDVDFETACNVFCSLVWVSIGPRMQVTCVCCSQCEICCFIGEHEIFQEFLLFLWVVQHVHRNLMSVGSTAW